MDYSARVQSNPERLKLLEERATNQQKLPKIRDILFKPKEVDLKDFHPASVIIRLREFKDGTRPASLEKITVTKTETGYTDEKEKWGEGAVDELTQKALNDSYITWGEVNTTSTQYLLNISGQQVTVLLQELLPIGVLLKIEAPSEAVLQETLTLLGATKEELIEKNAAVLLAEHLGFI